MLTKLIDGYCRLTGYLIAAMLALMVVLVFGNVFMRYALNSGFTLSEELSRWLFVWLTFLGAGCFRPGVRAGHQGTHHQVRPERPGRPSSQFSANVGEVMVTEVTGELAKMRK